MGVCVEFIKTLTGHRLLGQKRHQESCLEIFKIRGKPKVHFSMGFFLENYKIIISFSVD